METKDIILELYVDGTCTKKIEKEDNPPPTLLLLPGVSV